MRVFVNKILRKGLYGGFTLRKVKVSLVNFHKPGRLNCGLIWRKVEGCSERVRETGGRIAC